MDNHILLRFLSGECSEAEEQQVHKWLNEDQANRKRLEELTLIWSASGEEGVNDDANKWDTSEEWGALWNRIRSAPDSELASEEIRRKDRHSRSTFHSRYSQILRVAAILLIASMVGVVAWMELYEEPVEGEEPAFREVVIDRGQRSNMTLADGSNISINSDTRFLLPESFESNKRELFLESGEIFVDIVTDSERPFLIHIDDAVVEVLGTSFSVRSYPEDEEVKVVVREGTVALSNRIDPGHRVTLAAHQMGRFDLNNGNLRSEMVENLDLYLSWTDGYLKFYEEPLGQVVRQLERRFNIDIELSESELSEMLLTAELRGRTTYNVLNVITKALDIHYIQPAEDRIIFTSQPEESVRIQDS